MSRFTRALRPVGRVLAHPLAALLRLCDGWRAHRHRGWLKRNRVMFVAKPPKPDPRSSLDQFHRIVGPARNKPFATRRLAR